MNSFIHKAMSKIWRLARRAFLPRPKVVDPMLYPHKLEIVGGKLVCMDLVPIGSTIISGGIGNDIEFELAMIERKLVQIVGLDPTNTADEFIEKQRVERAGPMGRFTYLKKALSDTTDDLKLYFGDDDFMSSVSAHHRDTSNNFFICKSETLESLAAQYQNISYLKIDIEGAEYKILEKIERLAIPQISIEFHHFCSEEYSLNQTIALIEKIARMGYDVLDYGSFHGRGRLLPPFVAKWGDLNCELLFIKRHDS